MAMELKDHTKKIILIIENDESLVGLFEDLLKYEGFNVQSHQQADDIFELVNDFKPDVVLMDYMLPGINGGELCAQLKRDPATKQIPVIICSAYAPVLLSLGSYGCNAFVSKPFEIKGLLSQIEQCLAEPSRVFEMALKNKTYTA